MIIHAEVKRTVTSWFSDIESPQITKMKKLRVKITRSCGTSRLLKLFFLHWFWTFCFLTLINSISGLICKDEHVNCGPLDRTGDSMSDYFYAPSCSACPHGRTPGTDFCKGDCKWDYNKNKCAPKYLTGN